MNKSPDPNELVSIYQGSNITDAHRVRNLLLDDEIDAEVSEQAPLAGDFSCCVIVRREDEARARAIIARAKP